MAPVSTPAQPKKVASLAFDFNLVACLVLAVLAGLGLASVITDLSLQRATPVRLDATGPLVHQTLAGRSFAIPATWLADSVAKRSGFTTEIDLRLPLPLGPRGAITPIDIALVPLSRVVPSANLLDTVYLHRFMPSERPGPPGLVGKPLHRAGGYADETVWYDPTSPDPFVAKCMSAPGDTGPSRCLRTVRLGNGIAGIYRFDASVLVNWRQFDSAVGKWLTRIDAM